MSAVQEKKVVGQSLFGNAVNGLEWLTTTLQVQTQVLPAGRKKRD